MKVVQAVGGEQDGGALGACCRGRGCGRWEGVVHFEVFGSAARHPGFVNSRHEPHYLARDSYLRPHERAARR